MALTNEDFKNIEGVSLHGKNIRISFYYQGQRCFESLKGLKLTKANIKVASNKRGAVLNEIGLGIFDYRAHFPNSKKANKFSPTKKPVTFKEASISWLERYQNTVKVKQFNLVQTRIETYLIPKFGELNLSNITQSEIKTWRDNTLTKTLTNKTINDIFTPLRGVFEDAMADRIIDYNPLDYIKNLERKSDSQADPFSKSEIAKLTELDTEYQSERDGILLAIYSGLRISEWMALAWEDIDFTKGEIHIKRAIVDGDYGVPKTAGSKRVVKLLDQVLDILEKQRARTQRSEIYTIDVVQSDNRSIKKEQVRFVFLQTVSSKPFSGSNDFNNKYFKAMLEKCKIRYRPGKHARHTFASQLLTEGIPERWIMKQMGHTSILTFEKHYAKWMDEEMPEMASKASKLFMCGSNSEPVETKKPVTH